MSTSTITACQRCGSTDVRTQGTEWRCTSCLAKSPGYQARVLDDPLPYDQRPDHTARPTPEPVRDPWAAAATRAAELELTADPADSGRQDYELIGDLVWWTREHHEARPTEDDWSRSAPFGSDPASVYIKRFGSWAAAIAELERSLLPDDTDARPPATAKPTQATEIPRDARGRVSGQWIYDQVTDYLAANPTAKRRDAFRHIADLAGAHMPSVESSYYSHKRLNSQPAPAKATDTTAAEAETPAAPPPPPDTAVPAPAEEDSTTQAAVETPTPGVVEAPPATPIYGFDVDTTDLVTTRPTWTNDVDDARDELQLRYARSLLATLDATEVDDGAGCEFFWQLCDRIERVIGLQEAGA